KCQVGCMDESRLALTALTHLAAARSNICYFDIDSAFFHSEDPVIGGIVYEMDGRIIIPDTPGIGADIDKKYLEKMEKDSIS
ncbi:MAG: mandelate racemase/muconate lactonizing enzyme family protein, partial [Deltaproteobacteria bacterium]|nr:mandelate racemase/muconate lactonizing enzyme family protein [Deltaproteobacteria bacterium]